MPDYPKSKPNAHALGIRGQLMLFLCIISLFLLTLVWFLVTVLLQPLYNRYIYKNLSSRADAIVTLMDTAITDGTVISSRGLFNDLSLNVAFWTEMDKATGFSGTINLASCCVDISDTTLLHVRNIENVYPCLLHNSIGATFGGSDPSATRDSEEIRRLRALCFAEGSLYKIVGTSSGSRQMVVGRVTSDGSYAVLVSCSIVRVGEASSVLSRMLPWIAAILAAAALLMAWLFSRWFTQPLTKLSAAARAMSNGDYDVHVESSRSDELGLLARDFNHMANEVRRSTQLQRDLLANVSHDLRTPLTLIKGYAETVRDLTGDDKKKRDEQMDIIVDEADRLSGLVNSVMELSKVSSGTEKCERVRFDMGQLCEEIAERYDGVCAQNGWTLQLDVPEDAALSVYADPEMMERALHNLLGNAMHHIGPDKTFILRAAPLTAGVRVEVIDHGEGIRPEDLPYIFDRYYRSRSDAGKVGTGLGLSITKAIFRQHGFRFGVESALGKGTTFWFIMTDLPKPPSSAALNAPSSPPKK